MGFAAARSRVAKPWMFSEGTGDLCRGFISRQYRCGNQREDGALFRRWCHRGMDLWDGRKHAVLHVAGWASGERLPFVSAIPAARRLALLALVLDLLELRDVVLGAA